LGCLEGGRRGGGLRGGKGEGMPCQNQAKFLGEKDRKKKKKHHNGLEGEKVPSAGTIGRQPGKTANKIRGGSVGTCSMGGGSVG